MDRFISDGQFLLEVAAAGDPFWTSVAAEGLYDPGARARIVFALMVAMTRRTKVDDVEMQRRIHGIVMVELENVVQKRPVRWYPMPDCNDGPRTCPFINVYGERQTEGPSYRFISGVFVVIPKPGIYIHSQDNPWDAYTMADPLSTAPFPCQPELAQPTFSTYGSQEMVRAGEVVYPGEGRFWRVASCDQLVNYE